MDNTAPSRGDIRDLTQQSERLWNECFKVIGGELCVRCSDSRWRPVDWDTGYRVCELLWSSRLIDWKLQGRIGDHPAALNAGWKGRATGVLARLRVMWGRKAI